MKRIRVFEAFLMVVALGSPALSFAGSDDGARAAFRQCISDLGITSRPTQATMDKIKACVESKGYAMPQPPGHGAQDRAGGPPPMKNHAKMDQCLKDKGITLPSPASGERPPKPDEKLRTAFEDCRAQIASDDVSETAQDSGSGDQNSGARVRGGDLRSDQGGGFGQGSGAGDAR